MCGSVVCGGSDFFCVLCCSDRSLAGVVVVFLCHSMPLDTQLSTMVELGVGRQLNPCKLLAPSSRLISSHLIPSTVRIESEATARLEVELSQRAHPSLPLDRSHSILFLETQCNATQYNAMQ